MQGPNQLNSQKLKFRIISCSSEDMDYPVQELLTQSPQSKGWQSARFCDYPQEITLQFISPVRLRQVQFLSHQSKIATKVEMFIHLPDPNTPYQSNDIKYKKLGYLSLDSNERTNFQARELKSVYIDAPCLFLKLLMHKNHQNKYNLFNQVGLIAVSIFGEILSNNPEIVRQTQQYQQGKDQFYNDISYQTQFDPTTLERLRSLELAKQQALKDEDFEECKRIKEAIDRLKQIGIQLRQLDERKAIAIQNEDYDSARIIKAEIDRLRNAVAPDSLGQQQMIQQQRFQQRPQQQFEDQQKFNYPESKPSMSQQMQQQPQGQFKQSQSSIPPNQMSAQQLVNEDERMNNLNQEENLQENPQEQNDPQQNMAQQRQTMKQQMNLPHDEQVIPTLQNKKGEAALQESQASGQQQEQRQAEEISNEMKKFADPLIPILTLECCKSIFSKNWQLREEGLKWLDQEVRNPKNIKNDDPQLMFTAVMGAIASTLGDKIVQVSLASMSILKNICSSRLQNVTATKGDLLGYIDTILTTLIEKIGDTNQRLKEQAEQSLFLCGSCPIIGNQTVINAISKGANLKPKFQNSHKHLAARNSMLEQFVKKYGINNKDIPLAPVMEFAARCLAHANNEVRASATNLIVTVIRNVGEPTVQPFLDKVPSNYKDFLKQEQQGGASGQPRSKQTEDHEDKQTVIQTNIQHQGQSKPKVTVGQQKKKQPPAEENMEASNASTKPKPKTKDNPQSKTCEFCGKFNQEFVDSKQLDIHLWKECPMLTTCKECAQVIDVPNFGNHLLKECENQKFFKKCPRCKEPIHQNDYQSHTQNMACIPAKPETAANRCPLCHTDIAPGQNGWKKHLTIDQCPNNERTVQ